LFESEVVLKAEYLALAVAREDGGKQPPRLNTNPRPIAYYVPRGKAEKHPERGVKRA